MLVADGDGRVVLSGSVRVRCQQPARRNAENLEAWALSTLPRPGVCVVVARRPVGGGRRRSIDRYLRLLQEGRRLRPGAWSGAAATKAITNACIDRNHRQRAVLSLSGASGEGDESYPVVDLAQAGPLQIVIQKELERRGRGRDGATAGGAASGPGAEESGLVDAGNCRSPGDEPKQFRRSGPPRP